MLHLIQDFCLTARLYIFPMILGQNLLRQLWQLYKALEKDIEAGKIPTAVKEESVKTEIKWERVVYTMKDRKLSREVIK